MHAHSYIDLYCERTAPGFWNEPVNALSNLSFIIAAIFAYRIALARKNRDPFEIIVITMGGAIGVGSFLFHTFATHWTELADVIPIWSFVTAFVVLSIYRTTDENLVSTARITAIAGGITLVSFLATAGDIVTDTNTAPARLNGSLQYLPALIALIIFATINLRTKHPARYYVVGACLAFIVSLVFRTADHTACSQFAIGTHFMWHLLNGLMVGLLLQVLVLHYPPKARRRL